MAFYKFVHMSDARYMHKFEHMHNNVYSEVGIFVQPVLFLTVYSTYYSAYRKKR